MLKVLIWHVWNTSKETDFKDKAIKILEQQHNGIEIVGEAVNENIAKVDWGGQYDVLLCIGVKRVGINEVIRYAHKVNLPEEKLLSDWVVTIPGFRLEKYRQLQRSRLSIFSLDCFGVIISHTLNFKFFSPFINLFLKMPDFIKFLQTPNKYLALEPHFEKTVGISQKDPNGYPLMSLGDIFLYMQHYKTSEEAAEKWNERKQRINWDNLFVVAHTYDKDLLEEFDKLPYSKKVCFVPFKSNLTSAWYIDPETYFEGMDLGAMARQFAWANIFYYDPFDMLLYGKKTPLIDMDYNETYLTPNPFY